MRAIVASLISLVAMLVYGQLASSGSADCDACGQGHAAIRPCLEDSTNQIQSTCIEDDLLKEKLRREGVRLLAAGQTIDLPTLVSQLETRSCQLDLSLSEPMIQDAVQLSQRSNDSVVAIGGLYRCDKCTRWHLGIASGFVISSDGAIVTNYHVVDSQEKSTLVVMTSDHKVYPVQRVLAASRADDLAILQVDAQGLRPLPLGRGMDDAPVGADVSVISHPDGRFFCYTAGVVSRYMRSRTQRGVIDTVAITADYARGSSGAPVLNRQGQVVAVVSSTESIYYTRNDEQQLDVQMVYRTCIPVASLMKLIQPSQQMASRLSSE